MRRNGSRDDLTPAAPIQLVWSPEDSAIVLRDFERHAAEAMALTQGAEAAKAIHPATVSKQRAEVGDPEPAPERERARPCTVTDLFTRSRVR